MAVQKSKKSRSKRGMRRLHDKLRIEVISKDINSNEFHKRHHLTKNGYYRGKKLVVRKIKRNNKEI
ncbi:MAG: 50S ribosomal protein L32 [Enterobacteriaceae bacterium]